MVETRMTTDRSESWKRWKRDEVVEISGLNVSVNFIYYIHELVFSGINAFIYCEPMDVFENS